MLHDISQNISSLKSPVQSVGVMQEAGVAPPPAQHQFLRTWISLRSTIEERKGRLSPSNWEVQNSMQFSLRRKLISHT